MLHSLRCDWAPQAMIVSFKLETDESILLHKVSCPGCHYTFCCTPIHSIAPIYAIDLYQLDCPNQTASSLRKTISAMTTHFGLFDGVECLLSSRCRSVSLSAASTVFQLCSGSWSRVKTQCLLLTSSASSVTATDDDDNDYVADFCRLLELWRSTRCMP